MAVAAEVPPVPDPTLLTTAQLHREIDNVKDLLSKDIVHEHNQCELRFASIADQFLEIAANRREQKADTKAAVDAALSAAKEAVALQTVASDKSITKSETSTAEQIKAVAAQLTTTSKTVDDKLNEVKSRLDRIEAQKQGGQEQRVETRNQGFDNRALIAIAITVALFMLTVAGFVINNKP